MLTHSAWKTSQTEDLLPTSFHPLVVKFSTESLQERSRKETQLLFICLGNLLYFLVESNFIKHITMFLKCITFVLQIKKRQLKTHYSIKY